MTPQSPHGFNAICPAQISLQVHRAPGILPPADGRIRLRSARLVSRKIISIYWFVRDKTNTAPICERGIDSHL
jgi:hypothetical protein